MEAAPSESSLDESDPDSPIALAVTRDAEFRRYVAEAADRARLHPLTALPDRLPASAGPAPAVVVIDDRVAEQSGAIEVLLAAIAGRWGTDATLVVAVGDLARAVAGDLIERCDDIVARDAPDDLLRALLRGRRLAQERRSARVDEAAPGIPFRTLVEQGPLVTFINTITPSERIIYASPQSERLLGAPPQTFYEPDFDWREQLHPDDRSRVSQESALADAGFTRTIHEYRYRLPDGTYRWIRAIAALARDARSAEFWVGHLLDIDEDRRGREAAERHAAGIEILHELRRIIAHEERLPAIFEQTVALLAGVRSLPMARIYTLDDDGPMLAAAAGDVREGDLHPDHRRLIDRVVRGGVTNLAGPETEAGVSLLARGTPTGRLTAEVAAPLVDRGRVVGVLVLGGNRSRPIDPADVALAETVAEYLAMVAVRTRLQHDAHQQGLIYQTVVERVSDVIFQLTANLTIAYVNPAWSARLGYPPNRQIGMSLLDVIHPADRDRIAAELNGLATVEGGMIATETQVLAHDGQTIWMELRALTDPATGGQGDITGMLFDISARRRSDSELRESHERFRQLAFQDPLTGLPNRLVFADRLQHALAVAERRGAGVAALFIDLDGFKPVNDLYGHSAGDRVLAIVGERLRERLRGGDTIARFGGDEFAVILEDLDDPSQAMAIATGLIETMQAPIHLGVEPIEVGISIGITYLTGRHVTAEEAVAEADAALYEAKSGGRGRYALFERPDVAEGGERHRSDLRRGMQSGELKMLYFPIFALAGNRIAAVEARIRWDHPVYGRLVPGHFLRRADASGLLDELGEAALGMLARDLSAWRAQGLTVPQLRVAMSGRQALDARLDTLMAAAHDAYGLPGATFGIELTDGSSSAERAAVDQMVVRLRELGVTVGFDNYGSGNATLVGLARMQPEFININIDAIEELGDPVRAAALLRATLRQAEELGWTLIAKEAHTAAALSLVIEAGIAYAQGDALSPGMSASALGAMLKTHNE